MRLFVLLFIVLGFAGMAHATTLTFDGDICEGGGSCGTGSNIDQSYGDETGLNVIWDANASTEEIDDFFWWSTSYSDLVNVGYGASGQTATVTLDALEGYKITLNSFDMGAWPFVDRTTRLRVFELGSNVDFRAEESFVVSGQTASSFMNLGYTSSSGIVIDFGPDAFNVGLDNIDFTVMRDDGASIIPIPAGGVLLISAMAGFAALRRRRSA